MIAVNTTYNNLISAGGQYEWQIINGASTFSKVNLISGKITRTCYEQLSIGNVLAAQLELELQNVSIDTDSQLQVQFRATNGSSSSSWYTKGYFFIDTVESSPYSDITKITAFDAMLKTETPYQTSGEWIPTTDAVVLQRIVSDMGVTIDTTTLNIFSNDPIMLTAPLNIGTDGTTEREVLSYLGAMRGGNWIIGYDGKLYLQLLSPTATNTAAVGDAVVSFDASPAETIKRLRVWTSDDTCYAYPPLPLQTHTPADITDHNAEALLVWANSYIAGWDEIGGRCIDVKIPFWCDYAMGADLFAQLKDKAFVPFVANETYLDPKYEVGDGITIKDVTSIIANCTTTLNPLSPCDISLQKEDVINSYYPYKSTVQRTMEYNIAQNTATLAEHTSQILANAQAIEDVPSEIERATTMITGGFGGYVKWTYLADGTPSELLFMDSPDESTAVNILRINRNGIGFSTDGGNTYANAWTIDGKLNADFITTGTLKAVMIQDSGATPKNYWDLASGQFVTKQGTLGSFTIDQNGVKSGSVAEGGTGTIIYPDGITYAQTIPSGKSFKTDLFGTRLMFYVAENGGSYQGAGSIFSGISNGYGHIGIAGGNDTSSAIIIDDKDVSSDPAFCPITFVYNTLFAQDVYITGKVQAQSDARVMGDLTVDGTLNFGGKGSVQLLTGVQASNTINGAYSKYSGYVVVGTPGSSGYATCYIPKPAITSSDTTWLLSDQSYYINFKIKYSGSNIIFGNTSSNNGTKTVDIYGIV